tara:strand:- start:186 stop:398 length:213 start_codon:yes stop_codon:yes gene_type:complete
LTLPFVLSLPIEIAPSPARTLFMQPRGAIAMGATSFHEQTKEDAHDRVVYGCYAAATIWSLACAYFIFAQ